ncbi:MarR family transcriptional regulator [bacterium]|nr:MarR family transcriptional regulator [bacterium]
MGTKYKGSADEVRGLNTYIKLVRAAESLTAKLNRAIADKGLSISQFGALEALYHLGPLHQNRIGEKLLKSSGNITMVVDHLEQRGLVRRERDNMDRRCITVYLTDQGHALIAGIFPSHAKLICSEMSALSAEEQDQLAALCKKLGLGSAS